MDTTSRARSPANIKALKRIHDLVAREVLGLLEPGEFSTAKLEFDIKLADGVIQTVQGPRIYLLKN